MDLILLFNVLKRHKWMLAVGLAIGAVLAFNTVYRVEGGSGGSGLLSVRLAPRGFTTYQARANVMLRDPGFGAGRAETRGEQGDTFMRTVQLAPTYAQLVMTDEVLQAAARRAGTSNAGVASVVAKENSPVVEITVEGSSAREVIALASAVGDALSDYLAQMQRKNGIPERERILVANLGAPGLATPTQSRTFEIAMLAFLAPLVVAGAGALLMENLRGHGEASEQQAASRRATAAGDSSPAAVPVAPSPEEQVTRPCHPGGVASQLRPNESRASRAMVSDVSSRPAAAQRTDSAVAQVAAQPSAASTQAVLAIPSDTVYRAEKRFPQASAADAGDPCKEGAQCEGTTISRGGVGAHE